MTDIKLSAKREKFAQVWFATGNKSEAYRQCYKTEGLSENTLNANASRLSKHDKVLARYKELQKAAQKRNETTVDTLDKMLKEAWVLAKKTDKPAAMVSAVNGLAKLHGIDPQSKKEALIIGGKDEIKNAADIFDEMNLVYQGAKNGDLSSNETSKLSNMLNLMREAYVTDQLERKLEAIEEDQAE